LDFEEASLLSLEPDSEALLPVDSPPLFFEALELP
jgi:hypothetical protein